MILQEVTIKAVSNGWIISWIEHREYVPGDGDAIKENITLSRIFKKNEWPELLNWLSQYVRIGTME